MSKIATNKRDRSIRQRSRAQAAYARFFQSRGLEVPNVSNCEVCVPPELRQTYSLGFTDARRNGKPYGNTTPA